VKLPWSDYSIEDINADGVAKMSRLYHIAHLADARRVLEDRRINTELVRDESALNRTRICVVWTSPNVWHAGSLYGNVSFTLPLSVLDDRQFYWVEAMTKYSPTALRVLVSEHEIVSNKVTKFDPTELGHPLHRADDGTWSRLDDYNYEIMFDESFMLDECERIDLFDHHGRLCNKYGASRCPDAGRERKVAAARLAALALASDEPEQLAKLLTVSDADHIISGLAKIAFWITKRSYSHVAPSREERAALFDAAMHHYAYEKEDHARATISGLGSESRATKHLLRRTKEVFGEDVHMKLEHWIS
jgi:hypothetical protein